MKHKHIFKHIGGGCGFAKEDNEMCDDSYECECQARIRTTSSADVHFEMPKSISCKK
mgnify:CR=1